MKNQIRVLPQVDFIPASVEEYMSIPYMERKLLMKKNVSFFNAMAVLLKDEMLEYINDIFGEEAETLGVPYLTLDELLNCGYYGDDYESSRQEFANSFVEDFCLEDE